MESWKELTVSYSYIQLQKRNARGFKNVQYFINMIYQKLGKIKFELPHKTAKNL